MLEIVFRSGRRVGMGLGPMRRRCVSGNFIRWDRLTSGNEDSAAPGHGARGRFSLGKHWLEDGD